MGRFTFPSFGSASQTGGYRGDIGSWRTALRELDALYTRSPKIIPYMVTQFNAILANMATILSTVVTSTQAINISNSANTKTVAGTILVTPVGVVSANTPSTAAIVTSAQALVVPVTGTYVSTATVTVAAGVVTAIVLS